MKFMLSIFIINLCFSIVLINGQPHFMEFARECKTEINATQADMFRVIRHNIPETKNEECLLACILNKMGFLTADNKMNLDEIIKNLEHMKKFNNNNYYEKLKKIYEDCSAADSAEKDQCTAAKKFAQCVYPKEKEIFPPPRQFPPEFKSIQECKEKIEITEVEVENVMRKELPANRNEQCFLACVEKKIGNLGSDNKINMEKIEEKHKMMKKHSPSMYNKTIQIFTDCKTAETSEADECVAATNFIKCLYPKLQMMHFSPVMKQNVTECENKSSVTEVEVYSVLSNSVPKTKEESCFFACMLKRSGIMSADNVIQIEIMMGEYGRMPPNPNNRSGKILEECKALETKEADECEAAEKFAKCLFPKMKELRRMMNPPGHGFGHKPGPGHRPGSE